eukprot:COSAG02_NODE_9151_length_2308_cov_3.162517_2_plen_80_part_00
MMVAYRSAVESATSMVQCGIAAVDRCECLYGLGEQVRMFGTVSVGRFCTVCAMPCVTYLRKKCCIGRNQASSVGLTVSY